MSFRAVTSVRVCKNVININCAPYLQVNENRDATHEGTKTVLLTARLSVVVIIKTNKQ